MEHLMGNHVKTAMAAPRVVEGESSQTGAACIYMYSTVYKYFRVEGFSTIAKLDTLRPIRFIFMSSNPTGGQVFRFTKSQGP